MTICNFCGIRESRNRPFHNPYVCNDCRDNEDNYCEAGDDIIFIDTSNKNIKINSDTEIDIVNAVKEDNDSKLIDTTDFKDALLASLYAQVEFLRNQIEEKDLLIRTLIINENDVYIGNREQSHTSTNGLPTENDVCLAQNDDDISSDESSNETSDVENISINTTVNSEDTNDDTTN